ncbi:hypothetical protein [Aliikangiella coralliicola]|uniref:Carboxypeptidase regulatory-like domain-containing protein n=1 Tax=Aliikangiella coralliicola TaxID=2592383 RepID=A0A545UCW9_9GAMM|nr:hypothetical protein [Aliikangiella coralliicola]TQV87314.1 hypothetical protein FLL46_12760 [Aliikangiella coralliicola]
MSKAKKTTVFSRILLCLLSLYIAGCTNPEQTKKETPSGDKKPIAAIENKTIKESTSGEASAMDKTSSDANQLIGVTGITKMEKACGSLPTVDQSSCSGEELTAMRLTITHEQSSQEFNLTTDKNGQVKLKLPAGRYRVNVHKLLSVNPEHFEISEQQNEFSLTFTARLP